MKEYIQKRVNELEEIKERTFDKDVYFKCLGGLDELRQLYLLFIDPKPIIEGNL